MTDGKPAPVFDIAIGTSGRDTRVCVNGQDISAKLRGLTVTCFGEKLTEITLLVLGHNARVTVQGAMEAVKVIDD